MEIKFTNAQLQTLTDNGYTMDNLKQSVKAYREQGYSDEDIQRGLWGTIKKMDPHALNPVEYEDKMKRTWPRRVEEMKRVGLEVPEYAEDVPYAQRQKETYEMLQKKYDERRKSSERKIRNLERAGAFVHSAGSAATLGLSSLALAGVGALDGNDYNAEAKQWKEAHPGYSAAGTVAGFLVPGTIAVKGMKFQGSLANSGIKWVNGLANGAQARVAGYTGSKALGWGAKVLTNAIGAQAMFQMQETVDNVAATGKFESGLDSLNKFWQGGLSNAGWDVALQAVAGPAGKIAGVFSKTKKAIKAAGGVENVARGKQAAQQVLDSGGTRKEAAAAFYGTISEGLDDAGKATFEKLLVNDKEFARIMQQQAADAKQIVVNSTDAVTRKEYGKLSQNLLENAWGTSKNTLGKYEIDFTRKGLDQLLGLDAKGPVMEARKQALARAEQKVMANPSLARDVKVNFDDLARTLKNQGSRDLEAAFSKVEPGSIKSFEGSIEQTEAITRAQRKIDSWEKQAGKPLPSGEVDRIMNAEMRIGAEDHFRKIMAEGTDSVQDINDIKDFLDKAFVAEVEAGQAEAIGAFTQGINTQILDNLDNVLYESNQALRLGKELGKIHEFGKKYTDANFNELESILNNGTEAKEKAMKLAAFKMGMLDRVTEQAVAGQGAGLESLRSMMQGEKLRQYFSPEEVGAYIDKIRPKMEAANTLNGIINVAYKRRGEDIAGIMAPAIRAGVAGAVLHSPNVFMNSLVTVASRISPYGPKTAKMLQRLAENPDWSTFNRLVKSTTDPAEKGFLHQAILAAFEDAYKQEQYRKED